MSKKYIFIRNDDVRETLDKSLIQLTNLCTSKNIPISHTVEPANASKEVIDWLTEEKSKYPELIEIVQHGYSHNLNYKKTIGGKLKKGEFGGDRTYDDQLKEIKSGKEILDKYFGKKWFPLFTFPYGARNDAALCAVRDAGFKAVNGSMGSSTKHKLFYFIGRLLNKEMLFGRKISYNLRFRKKYKLFQIDTAISIIKKYVDEGENADFYTIDELKAKTERYFENSPSIGIVLHHRYHNTDDKIKLMDEYFDWLQSVENVQFVSQEFLYKTYHPK